MIANFYKELSNKNTIVNIEPNQTIAEAFKEYNLSNAIIVVNGKEESPEYKIKEDDIILIRLMPGMTGFLIALTVAAIAVGAYTGYKLYKKNKELQRELEKMKKLTNKSDIDNRPFLRGASNTYANGNSQPYLCGRNFFTPYILSEPFYKLHGTDGISQYIYTALECGFNKQVLESVSIDDVKIKTFNDSEPQEGVYNLDAGNIFAEDGKIEIAQDGALLEELTELNYKVVSNSVNAEVPKDYDVSQGTKSYLIYTLNRYAKDVEVAITFPYGLYAYNSDNDKISTQVTITPQYSLDGGSTWVDFTFNNNGTMTNVFNRNVSTKELRFAAKKEFTLADYETLASNNQTAIIIRIRSNGNATDTQIHNDCYVMYYQSMCFDPNKSSMPAGVLDDNGTAGLVLCNIVEDRERAFCTTLGLKLKASKNNEDKFKKINIISNGLARTWDGTEWSEDKELTRNPAAWALEVLTSECHKASRFLDSEIDLEAFGDFYEYCELNNFNYDYVITQNKKKEDTLNQIMDICGAVLYWDMYGRLSVAIDRPVENALAIYNPQNIISISNKKSFDRQADGLRIKYVTSENDLFVEDTYLVMREVNGVPLVLNEDSVIKDITLDGVTTHEHVVKYARRLMALEEYRDCATTIEVGNEGIYYTPYSMILLQDDSLKIGLSDGLIEKVEYKNSLLDKIYINGLVDFDPLKEYGIIVDCFNATNGKTQLAFKVTGTGRTNELQVLTPYAESHNIKPEAGYVFSFGELDEDGEFSKITTPYLISNITRNGTGFKLELVNYNEAVYDPGIIPIYKTTQTPIVKESADDIPVDYITERDLNNAISAMQTGNIPAGKPDTPLAVSGTAHKDEILLSCVCNTDGLRNDIKNIKFTITKNNGTTAVVTSSGTTASYIFDRDVDGYPEANILNQWTVSAVAENIYGKKSVRSTVSYISTTDYGTWKVNDPEVMTRVSDRTITLLMTQPPMSNLKELYGNVKYKISVKRFDDVQYFCPATTSNPYASENNYKDTTASQNYLVSNNVYTQCMSLRNTDAEGHDIGLVDTHYKFKVIAFNEATESDPVIVDEDALCSSLRDIVKANETAKQAYITQLSAISADLGVIKAGSMTGNDQNYWALSNIEAAEGHRGFKQGEFRVGSDTQYIKFDPEKNKMDIKADIEIEGDFANIRGELAVYPVKDEYKLSTDTQIVEGKNYYTRSGTDPNYVYTFVAEPVLAELLAGLYYEKISGSESGLKPALQVLPNEANPKKNQTTVNGNFSAKDNSTFGTSTVDENYIRQFLEINDTVRLNITY